MYICKEFSLQMLPSDRMHNLKIEPISLDEVKSLKLHSAIDHSDTANMLSEILGQNLPAERANVLLEEEGDEIIVAQTEIRFFKVSLH